MLEGTKRHLLHSEGGHQCNSVLPCPGAGCLAQNPRYTATGYNKKNIAYMCIYIHYSNIHIYLYIYICLYIYIYILLPIFCETPLRMNLGPSRCGSSIHDINRMKTIDIISINKDRMKTIDTISIALLFSLHSIVAKTLQKFAVESES